MRAITRACTALQKTVAYQSKKSVILKTWTLCCQGYSVVSGVLPSSAAMADLYVNKRNQMRQMLRDVAERIGWYLISFNNYDEVGERYEGAGFHYKSFADGFQEGYEDAEMHLRQRFTAIAQAHGCEFSV